jgi:hypothetical protein
MQKVVGSSPISRLEKPCTVRGFFVRGSAFASTIRSPNGPPRRSALIVGTAYAGSLGTRDSRVSLRVPARDLDDDSLFELTMTVHLGDAPGIVIEAAEALPANVVHYAVTQSASILAEEITSRFGAWDVGRDLRQLATRVLWWRIGAIEESVRRALDDEEVSAADYAALRDYPDAASARRASRKRPTESNARLHELPAPGPSCSWRPPWSRLVLDRSDQYRSRRESCCDATVRSVVQPAGCHGPATEGRSRAIPACSHLGWRGDSRSGFSRGRIRRERRVPVAPKQGRVLGNALADGGWRAWLVCPPAVARTWTLAQTSSAPLAPSRSWWGSHAPSDSRDTAIRGGTCSPEVRLTFACWRRPRTATGTIGGTKRIRTPANPRQSDSDVKPLSKRISDFRRRLPCRRSWLRVPSAALGKPAL